MTADNSSNNNQDVEQQPQTADNETTLQQKEPVKGPGKLLQEAREAQGLSTREVADRLRLRLQIIELIEADEYDSFSTPTFIKGYLKSYGKVLDVNEDDILAAYRSLNIQEPDNTSMQSFSRRVKHQESDNRLMLMTYVVIIVVIGLVIWWWQDSDFSFDQLSQDVGQAVSQAEDSDQTTANQQNQTTLERSSTTQEREPAAQTTEQQNEPLLESEVQAGDTSTSLSANDPEQPTPTVDETSADVALESAADEPNSELDEEGSVANPSTDDNLTDGSVDNEAEGQATADNQETQTTEPATDPVNEAPAAQLVFRFSEECWIKVDDAEGETQAVGIKPQGYEMPVPGQAPFAVTVCKPSAVSISFQGEEVDLSSFRQSRVARFTVPLSN